MSEYPLIHINRPKNPQYLVRTRFPGHQRYELHGNKTTTEAAFSKLGRLMATNKYKRGDVLMVTDDYYGPSMLVEMVMR